MNTERSDFDRTLRTWFEDGPTVLSDRVVDDIAARIGRQPQRRTWRLRGRPFMSTYAKLAAAAAAVLIVGFVGWQLLPGNGIGGRPTPAPTPAATATEAPTAAATVAGIVNMSDGVKAAGTYRSFALTAAGPTVGVVYDLPAGGWGGVAGDWLASPDGLGAPAGLGIAFLGPGGIFGDPCHWDAAGTGTWPQPPDIDVGPSVDDLATALGAQSAYESTAPVAVTIGGADGVRMGVTIPPELDLSTCDNGNYFVFGASSGSVNLYAQGQGNIWDLSILDVEGTRIVIVVEHYAGTSQATRDGAESLVQSIVFNR